MLRLFKGLLTRPAPALAAVGAVPETRLQAVMERATRRGAEVTPRRGDDVPIGAPRTAVPPVSGRSGGGEPPRAPPNRGGGGHGRVPPVPKIYLSEPAIRSSDAYAVVGQVIEVVNFLCFRHGYMMDEIPAEYAMVYSADFYYQQVLNGGHGQFTHNAAGHENTWRFARAGLAAMGAADYLAAFDELCAILARDPARAEAIRKGAGFGTIDPAIEALDTRFFELHRTAPLTGIMTPWLVARPEVEVLPAEAFARRLDELAADPALAARREAQQAAALAERMKDASFRLGHALAKKAGRTFQHWSHALKDIELGGRTWPDVLVHVSEEAIGYVVSPGNGVYELYDARSRERIAVWSILENGTGTGGA
ncbi:DMP19 family protein [Methylobrevis albus]|uniref:DUF4375 domain-containing protein n=1 Tax=Methylobrevis albus TaxID=2793297 RepID=A0A931HZN3_9HYPH|nr:DUF4375 domain-containing protein [Methylobrevis albus]MBH0236271.1 DUF4375 domain-containing protein [Methylobrevis albus]